MLPEARVGRVRSWMGRQNPGPDSRCKVKVTTPLVWVWVRVRAGVRVRACVRVRALVRVARGLKNGGLGLLVARCWVRASGPLLLLEAPPATAAHPAAQPQTRPPITGPGYRPPRSGRD